MKRIIFILCGLLPFFVMAQETGPSEGRKTITVTNPTDRQRQELVSIDASRLGIDVSKGAVVRDAFGIEQASQLTYDGQFLLDVHVALTPTPFRPTDFLKAFESYLPPVFRTLTASMSFPCGMPRP